MNRRHFLQASAAIATSRFPILGANERVNVGIVGVGGRGTDHINSYGSLPQDCRISAVCDVNQAARERAVALVSGKGAGAPKEFTDMRGMFDSKDVDAVSIATPNHWHALATIWACQAGKDVYVEKPASHNVWEGGQMVKAARKYKRMVQVGSQGRSTPHKIRAMQLLAQGAIGTVYHARGICFRRRFSIGHTPEEPVPPGIDWDLFLGPAEYHPYTKNRYAYNWHWFWATGNGDIGNQGVHEMDICLWGLPENGWPAEVSSVGGKYVWEDDQETPNTLSTAFAFGKSQITFDTRNLPTPTEGLAPLRPNWVGNIFMGEKGFMVVDGGRFQIYESAAANVKGEGARGAGAGNQEKYTMTAEEKSDRDVDYTAAHMKNFLDAVRSRNHKSLTAEIEIGARSAAFCHLGNISYRVGSALKMGKDGRFIGNPKANELLTRNYRPKYAVPENV